MHGNVQDVCRIQAKWKEKIAKADLEFKHSGSDSDRAKLVDVKAGPIDRRLGITTVQLHTAAATTDASIPGLEPDVAAALRDRLARRGEQRSAGL